MSDDRDLNQPRPICAVKATFLASLLLFVWSASAFADVSLDEAIAAARQDGAVTILRAATRNIDGRSVHEIRVLTDAGRVKTLLVDAKTGNVQ